MRVTLNKLMFTILCLSMIFDRANFSLAAEMTPQLKAAVAKGASFLKANAKNTQNGAKSLVALAMIKADLPPETPEIEEAIQAVLKKIDENHHYKPKANNFYETGLDAYLLVEAGGDKYREQVQYIVNYLVEEQRPEGAWDYHPEEGKPTQGDTSCTHYACLGLWAAQRIGIQFDVSVWENVLKWHIARQNPDGGYAYCPGFREGDGGENSIITMTINGVCTMQIAAMQIDEQVVLSGPVVKSAEKAPVVKEGSEPANEEDKKKFGVLEAVELVDKPVETKIRLDGVIPPAAYTATKRSLDWMQSRYFSEGPGTGVMGYYYYSMERMGALANVDQIGSHNWFNEISGIMLKEQKPDGSWALTKLYSGTEVDTAFCILFLTRSTGKLIKRIPPPVLIGDGLLAGGRGLPDDLADAQYDGRAMKEKPKPTEPLDKLLASLSSTGDIDIADVQKQIIAKVQIGDKATLIGQIDQLVTLVDHPEAEVRRTVAWALGRTDNMDLAKYLITGLSDKDIGVMIESQNALCWLSRKTKGFGLSQSPLDDVSANATEQQKSDAISAWHKKAVLRWGEWYLNNRPFADRGDEFEAKLRADMERLKSGG